MEKIQNRKDYINAFKEFSDTVALTDEFMRDLKKHKYFRDALRYIEVSKYSNFSLS